MFQAAFAPQVDPIRHGGMLTLDSNAMDGPRSPLDGMGGFGRAFMPVMPQGLRQAGTMDFQRTPAPQQMGQPAQPAMQRYPMPYAGSQRNFLGQLTGIVR